MTLDEMRKLADQAGWAPTQLEMASDAEWARLERFAALVEAAEREACAKVCVGISNEAVACSIKHSGNRDKTLAFFNNSCAAEACADAIRARSTP